MIAQIEDLEATTSTLTRDFENLKSQIGVVQVQMKRAGEDRESQNKEFLSTVADRRVTQKLLQATLSILGEFYGKG